MESLKLRVQCGCSEKAWNKRCTVDLEMPLAWAAYRTVRRVPRAGLRDSVRFDQDCDLLILDGARTSGA